MPRIIEDKTIPNADWNATKGSTRIKNKPTNFGTAVHGDSTATVKFRNNTDTVDRVTADMVGSKRDVITIDNT